MKTICAIARNEHKYLRDWVLYHLDLGFDKVFVYNHGNNGTFTHDKLTIIPFEPKTGCPQTEAYNDYVKNNDFSWCAFIDVDEFITGDLSILDKVQNYDAIRLYEKLYGDDELIYPTEGPVYSRITHEIKQPMLHSKMIVKKRDWNIDNPHVFRNKLKVCNSNLEEVNMGKSMEYYNTRFFNNLYIRHYRTKTLKEFCEQKLDLPRVYVPKEKRTFEYYFRVNKKTEAKLNYIRSLYGRDFITSI